MCVVFIYCWKLKWGRCFNLKRLRTKIIGYYLACFLFLSSFSFSDTIVCRIQFVDVTCNIYFYVFLNKFFQFCLMFSFLVYFTSKPMFPLLLRLPEKKLKPIKWAIYKHDINKKCLSVGNSGILSVVVCSASVTYTSLCRGLKYVLKLCYITLVYFNLYYDYRDFMFGQVTYMALCLKKYHKNELQLCLLIHIFTKFSHSVCLINVHILMYCDVIYNCKLWKVY